MTDTSGAVRLHRAARARQLALHRSDIGNGSASAEDAFEAARTENKQKLQAHIDQARASVERFKETVQQNASMATDRAKDEWKDVQGRIAKRVDKIRSDVEVRKHEFAADRAELRADLKADEASLGAPLDMK